MTGCESCGVPGPHPSSESLVLEGGWGPPCVGVPEGRLAVQPCRGAARAARPSCPPLSWPKPPSLGHSHPVVLVHRRPNAEQTLEHPWFKVSLDRHPVPGGSGVPLSLL